MAGTIGRLRAVSGTFFRIMFEHQSHDVLRGAASPQGRYHHNKEPALYISPHPEWAQKAVESYVQHGDPERSVHPLLVYDALVADVRDRELCRLLGIEPSDSDVPWQPQLANGVRPSTWNVSDAARQAGADGLIYTARSDPTRWHLVLFRWNDYGGPTVTVAK
jgi:RES domain-containing protein